MQQIRKIMRNKHREKIQSIFVNDTPVNLENLENKTFVIMGIANKRSIGFGVAKVLDQLGAKLVFTYRKDRSKKELEKLIEQLNQETHHMYQIDVQSDEDVVNGVTYQYRLLHH